MADVPVGAVPAPTAPAAAPAVVRRAPSAIRAEKIANVSAGLAKFEAAAAAGTSVEPAAETPASAAAAAEKPTPAALPAEPAKASDKPAAEKPADKPADEPVDDKTAKGIAAIDRRAAKFREEQAAAKAEIELERAELARMRAEVSGKASSFEELQKLAKRDPIAALAKLGIDSEDDWENVGRGAYPRTKAGKADPRAQPAVAQTARERELADKLAEVDQKLAKIDETMRQRDAQSQSQKFVSDYLDSAVKAIPADKPTLIAKLLAKSPEKARQALLQTGVRMERDAMAAEGATKYDPSFTPSHAEVIAEYEKGRRAELEEQGVDVDALLAPPKPAAPAPAQKPAATLDPTSPTGTRPTNGSPTRAEKLRAVTEGLKKLDAERN